ncbi:unnamed protein product [Arabidopsis halleri]
MGPPPPQGTVSSPPSGSANQSQSSSPSRKESWSSFEVVNGVANLTIPDAVVDNSIPLWKNFAVGHFMGDAPHVGTIHATVNRIWTVTEKASKIDVQFLTKSSVLFRIDSKRIREHVLERRYWHIGNVPLVVSEWNPESAQSPPDLSAMPLWVDLKGVPADLFSLPGLSFLSSTAGNYVKLHPNTERCIRLDVARILVEVNLQKPLVEQICFPGPNDTTITVTVSYPWLPPKCSLCSKWGHNVKECTKKVTLAASAIPTSKEVLTKEVSAQAVKEIAQGLLDDLARSPVYQGLVAESNKAGVILREDSPSMVIGKDLSIETESAMVKITEDTSSWTVVKSRSPLKSPRHQSTKIKQGNGTTSPNGFGILNQIDEENELATKEELKEKDTTREEGEVVESETEEDRIGTFTQRFLSEAMISLFAWNIRGFNQPRKHKAVRNWIHAMRPSFGSFIETRVQVSQAEPIIQSILPDWSYSTNYEHHRLGRIWVVWSPEVNITILSKSSQQITCLVQHVTANVQLVCSFIYASNFAAERRSLWAELSTLHNGISQNSSTPWIVVGDFNEVLSIADHSRALDYSFNESGMRDFQNVVSACDLMDLSSSGPTFTWINNQDDNPIGKKLDRALINHAWLTSFPQSHAIFEAGVVSDHLRCVIHLTSANLCHRKPFRFFDFMATHELFIPTVAEVWSGSAALFHSRAALSLFHQKLKSLKFHLRALNRTQFGDIPRKTSEAYDQCSILQTAANSDPSQANMMALSMATERWHNLAALEERFSKQKSRINWLRCGDHNTTYFHRVAQANASKNAIRQLTTESGAVLTKMEEIKAEAARHFRSFLQQEDNDYVEVPTEYLSNLLTYRCSAEQCAHLVSPVTGAEIRQALLSLPSGKASGPDGYTKEFFVEAWTAQSGRIGKHPRCDRVCVTHLSFADDLLVFSDGSPNSLRETMMVFAEFAIISGLRINASKSAVFVGGTSQQNTIEAATEHGLQVEQLPILWRLFSLSGSLWVAWTKQNLMRNGCFWTAPNTMLGSWIWRKLLKLRDDIKPFIRAQVNNGETVSFWHDHWLSIGRLIDLTGVAGPRILGIPLQATVKEALGPNGWRLRRTRLPHFALIIEHLRTLPVPSPTRGSDQFFWRHEADDFKPVFSTSHTWEQIRVSQAPIVWNKVVWFHQGIPRCSFITWLAIRDRLSTGARMRLWGREQPCVLCGERDETRDHLFFACPYSFNVWSAVAGKLLGQRLDPDWDSTIDSLVSGVGTRDKDVLVRLCFQVTVYYVWRERNTRIHGGGYCLVPHMVRSIDKQLRNRIVSLDYTRRPRLRNLLQTWFEVSPIP